ncbi:hypothetical protein KDA_41440 [Dictyobacter alpinus]|uniref:Uncharacterized protein n=1 Tax=Dictyobacter alpinus TaxID=2014873 RepID=A0A402BBJ8_9CHLR|nr:hypothetical protein [Dictyobacter alpinus]GCE28660.1 hypothetical protein KDA_41440 [Dictyobacter alpinus]
MEVAINTFIDEAQQDIFHQFDLGGVFPGHEIMVNISSSIISLVSKERRQEGYVLSQRVLTETEMRVLLPLLTLPHCCPHEILQASYHCPFDKLVQALFSHDVTARVQWNQQVHMYRERLFLAHQQGTKRAEMRGVYNALFGLRQKLEQMGISIRARRDGYYLYPLKKNL